MTGRPTKLTKALVEAICADVAAGLSLVLAAEAAEVSRVSLYNWMAEGRADTEADVPPGFGAGQSGPRFFLNSLARARAQYARGLSADLAAGEKDHRSLAYLERTRLAAYYGDRALDAAVVAEAAVPKADDASPGQPGAVQVELVRCASCGEDQLPGKRLCGDCGVEMPKAGA